MSIIEIVPGTPFQLSIQRAGTQGVQGDVGPQGETGPQGVKGDTGDVTPEALAAQAAAEAAAAEAEVAATATETALDVSLGLLATDVASTNIPTGVLALRTAGYGTQGIGQALYAYSATEPSDAGKLQSLDGKWWRLSDDVYKPEQFGAGQGATILLPWSWPSRWRMDEPALALRRRLGIPARP